MKLLFIDTEFNGFGGELISMAIVSSDNGDPEFYIALDCPNPSPWVAANVIPHIGIPTISYVEAQTKLRAFLNSFTELHIMADWPEDITHLLNMLIVGHGEMMKIPDLTTTITNLPKFNSSLMSSNPHNALSDAIALRDYYVRFNK